MTPTREQVQAMVAELRDYAIANEIDTGCPVDLLQKSAGMLEALMPDDTALGQDMDEPTKPMAVHGSNRSKEVMQTETGTTDCTGNNVVTGAAHPPNANQPDKE